MSAIGPGAGHGSENTDHEHEEQITATERTSAETKKQEEKPGHEPGDSPAESVSEPATLSKYDQSWFYRLITPRNCRWDPKSPAPLTLPLCYLYAIPILNKIAVEFNVSYETSSQVATLMQAGYAAGIVFVLPLGDMLERRPFIISLVCLTATLWIGLCVTHSFDVFRALSFICGLTTVTPQLMIPLVGDFAPDRRKAALLSIIVSGLILGMLVARLLSGVVSNFTDWRNIYWFSCGAQYVLVMLLFAFMPDYPSTNPDGLGYLKALRSIPYMMVTEPVLIQACLIQFTLSCVFTGFWTTLTFLLASPPYEYSSLVIGLFSLLGISTLIGVPIIGRFMDRFVPLFPILLGQTLVLVGCAISTGIGEFVVAGPIIQGITIDLGGQTTQVANRTSIFAINPKARNRVNTAYMAMGFAGQLTGTAMGNRLYAQGGWAWSSGTSIGFTGVSMLVSLARGPRETGWVGWAGGWKPRKDEKTPPEIQQHTDATVEEGYNMQSKANA
ncbi:major facilitator superfamily domain-containing protein [Stachybotrys elegans]|uniref:Major facilitator superfamily domain-containing protein n=1 Tax=Stachybotrys elegans TaxID=80388 RepID=A0A8K0T755_9HYPO|nr:major facilitator superfamily domain-containing protein [Stachybotrys elegans]